MISILFKFGRRDNLKVIFIPFQPMAKKKCPITISQKQNRQTSDVNLHEVMGMCIYHR